MAETITRQLRVLHIVSSNGINEAMQASLFMPLATRLPKQRVKTQVIALSPGAVRSAMLRQNGVPTHDLALSRKRFSAGSFKEVVNALHAFRPDVIQAWGHTAQIVSLWARKRCDWKPKLIWGVSDTLPLAKDAGFIDHRKLKLAAKLSSRPDRIVYSSEAGAAHHRRVGFPDGGHVSIGPGVDATRFKPDPAARNKVREQLEVPHEAFVIGMVAPFQPEYDHATLLKAIGEMIKTNPNLYVLLAGHGVQRGNAPLMAMVGGGTLGTRTQLLGEWSDLTSLFNACDLVCSSALNDSGRMVLAMGMLCGVPCVATGMGAQGELIGQHGVAVEPGSPAAFIRGINKVLQLTPERRLHMANAARKYALQNFVYVRSLQKYLQLYADLVGHETLAATTIAAPVADESPITAPVAPPPRKKEQKIVIAELSDPDSLEAKVASVEPESLPKWRVEQEQARAEQDARWAQPKSARDGDVLEIFAAEIAKPTKGSASPMGERARGVADELEELLPVEAITAPAPAEAANAVAVAKETAPAASKPAEAPTAAPTPVAQSTSAVASVAAPAPSAEPVAHESKVSSENTWTGEQVVLALEDPLFVPNTAQPTPAVAENEPKQESLFDLELMPEEPVKTAQA